MSVIDGAAADIHTLIAAPAAAAISGHKAFESGYKGFPCVYAKEYST